MILRKKQKLTQLTQLTKLTQTIILITSIIILTNPQCLSQFEYFDSNTNLCIPCGYNCIQCFDSTTCLKCTNQFYLNQVTTACDKCPFGCQICTDSNTCITCNEGLYIDSNGNCLPCSTGVSSCSIAVIEQCHEGYFLLGGICAECLDNCKSCEDFVSCTSCQTSYYLASNSLSCISCSQHCQICTDSSTCTACANGYSVNGGACVLQDCSMYAFCAQCNSAGCLSCQGGKYMNTNGLCVQGASILCQESTGPYYTNCQVGDYGCPDYAVVQVDQSTSQKLPVCLPFSATQYAEYLYGSNNVSNCVSSSCGSPFSELLNVTTRKSYYKVEYHMNVRLYSSSSHTINITALNSSTFLSQASNTHLQSISLQLSTFSQSEPSCPSCPYGQVYLSGTLQSNGYQQSSFNISDSNGSFTIVEYIFKFFTCTVYNCETCTTVSDCVLCVQPYLLQLVSCVSQCDAGFYKYQRYCLLECPSSTYPIQSSYECQTCISPCLTCSSSSDCLSCVDGYFLQSNKCVVKCSSSEYFGNSTSRECQSCPNPCQSCEVVNSTYVKCLSCMVGYWYLGERCVFVCPVRYYDTFLNEISQCSLCEASCSQCYISNDTCAGCVNGYLLYETYCNQTIYCPLGYYVSLDNVCAACQFPCATCISTSTNCTSCLKGSLYEQKCYSTCPPTYYTDVSVISNITCQPCINNCLTCLSSTICLSCINSTYLYGSQCLTNCPTQQYYANPLNNTCTECAPPCKECISPTVCLSCSTGYLDGNKCTLQCNSSSYINSNFQCTLCPSPCTQCYSATQCIQCSLPYILNNSNCITPSTCESLGKYISYTKDTTNTTNLYGECKQCTYPCATCQTSSIVCLSCVSSYLYLSDMKTCQQSCPSTYYQSNSQCLKCSTNCYQCSVTDGNCSSCSSGNYLDTVLSKCVSVCADGYYGDNQEGKCLRCVSPCSTCYNIYFCKSCLVGIFYNKVCVQSCPSGTIYNSTLNQCIFCTNNCLTCSLLTNNCTSCISGYYFNYNNNSCTSTCVSGYYPDSYSQGCQTCISPCLQCNSSTECITCVSSYYLSGSTCVLTCPNQYYPDSTTYKCQLCNLTICDTCQLTQNNCLTCANNYFYDAVSLKCLLTCPSGYYPESITRTCKACQFPCTQCLNTSYCTQCQTNYKLYLNRCYSSCPIGYYGTTTCIKCANNCQICTSSTNCSKCISTYFVQNGLCVSNCSIGKYKGKQDMTNYDYCIDCPSNCFNCEDYNTCLMCLTGYYLFNGLCLTDCPILHYSDLATQTCIECGQNCVECVNSTYCTKCINSYIYHNECYTQCPLYTYVLNEQSCQDCVSPCKQCESEFTCVSCVSGYLYYHAYCVSECPKDVWYYPHNQSCSSECPYNKYQQKMICYVDGCGGKLVQLNGYCVKNCPIGYYVSKKQSCVECSSNNEQICKYLFVADLQVLRSQQLTLVLYYSQPAQIIQSISQVNITFADQNNKIVNLTLTSYQLNSYSLTFKYSYQQVNFITAYVTIPYVNSLESQQAISTCSYSQAIYYFNNYQQDKSSLIYSIANILPIIIVIGLLLCIIINLIAKTSHFLQLLDLVQLIAACLYLQIQYPIMLQKFLKKLSTSLFTLMPHLITHFPYAFSSPKYIFNNIDTSFTRTHLLTFIIFITLLIVIVVLITISQCFTPLPKIINRLKYRNLNDLFAVFSFPLLLFSFAFIHAKTIDILLGVIVIFLTLAWIVFISNLIIQAQQMGDLKGLLSDYQAVSSKLGLMYTPFSYIRRFIVALVFCIFPEKPLAALTLLLIFTILILICLFFYQPFASQVTDYVSMYLQFTLIVFIILIVIIGLDIMQQDGNRMIAIIAIILVSLAMIVGLGWLAYLTFQGFKKFIQNPNQQDQKDTEDCIKDDRNQNSSQGPRNKQQQNNKENDDQHSAQHSAANLIHPNLIHASKKAKNNLIDDGIQSPHHSNSNKEEFKHWNDEDEDESQSNSQYQNEPKDKHNGRLPEMLMKKILQEKEQQKEQ